MVLPTLLVLVGLLAELTHIRLLIVVGSDVGLHCPFCREPLVTNGTGEGLHFVVDVLDVSIAVAPVGEFGRANVAAVRLVLRMAGLVAVQEIFGLKALIAHFADVRFSSGMILHVIGKADLVHKVGVAHRTDKLLLVLRGFGGRRPVNRHVFR